MVGALETVPIVVDEVHVDRLIAHSRVAMRHVKIFGFSKRVHGVGPTRVDRMKLAGHRVEHLLPDLVVGGPSVVGPLHLEEELVVPTAERLHLVEQAELAGTGVIGVDGGGGQRVLWEEERCLIRRGLAARVLTD